MCCLMCGEGKIKNKKVFTKPEILLYRLWNTQENQHVEVEEKEKVKAAAR